MIFWNRNEKLTTKMSIEESENLLKKYALNDTITFHNTVNNIINFIIPAILFVVFKFSILKLVLAFIITDIILIFFNYIILHFIPYLKTKNLSINGVEKRIDKMVAQKEKLYEQLTYVSWNSDAHYILEKDIDKLINFIKIEKKYLKTENKKQKEKQITDDKRKEKDFENKVDYFKNYITRTEFYIADKDMSFLVPVKESLEKLINILEKRPIGLTMIPQTLYIYLSELNIIIEKVNNLGANHISIYSKDIENVSNGLHDNILDIVKKIEQYDTDDIEVGIAVLLQELNADKKEEENNTNV